MEKMHVQFANSSTCFYFEADFEKIEATAKTIYLIDQNVADAHAELFVDKIFIKIPSGEIFKNQQTVDKVIHELIELKADRYTQLVGVGGGVTCDLTGYISSIYMRGVSLGFVPTTILAMVDAAIGGKNGINHGVHKNMIGSFKQPKWICYDERFLQSLPKSEWINGFAEIIKHACIQDVDMFRYLKQNSIEDFMKNKELLMKLIHRNVGIKVKIVQKDEWERNERRWLNFGHTIGHAIENKYALKHGYAISIGMCKAAEMSANFLKFGEQEDLETLLRQYHLPTDMAYEKKELLSSLMLDKKMQSGKLNFVMVEKIGKATIIPIFLRELEKII